MTQTKEISLDEGEELDIGTITMEETTTGKIYGYVVTVNGDPIELVNVQLKIIKTKSTKSVLSDNDGYFKFENLGSGVYMIIARKKGYKKFSQRIKLDEGEEKEIEIVMRTTKKAIVSRAKH